MSPAPESSPTNCSEAIDQRFHRRLRAIDEADIWRNFSKVVGHWKFTRDRLRSKQLNWSLFSAVDRKKVEFDSSLVASKNLFSSFPRLRGNPGSIWLSLQFSALDHSANGPPSPHIEKLASSPPESLYLIGSSFFQAFKVYSLRGGFFTSFIGSFP